MPELKTVKLASIRFDQSVYPRKSHDPSLVQKYVDCLDAIEEKHNYMSIAEDMTLLDGRHRHLAYLKKYENNSSAEINVFVYPVVENKDKFSTAIELNSVHGYQLSDTDKARCAIDLFTKYEYPLEDIARMVSARKQRVMEWTRTIREEREKRQNETIFESYLACYTEQEISEQIGVSRDLVHDKIEDLCKTFPGTKGTKLSIFEDDDWIPPLYDIWSFAAKTNEVSHFGNSEQRILENLIYLYTHPFDIIVDPFAGGGSTIDVCKRRLRRYWTSDRKPIMERREEIRLLDIGQELPSLGNRWAQVTLTYLDPPYWKQAEGQYSKDAEDLANMPLDKFVDTMANIIKGIAKKQSHGVIAMLMQPTQWKSPNKEVIDHVFDIINAVGNKATVTHRVSCPYSTQQCQPQQVEWAKANKDILVLTRELVIWKVNGS